MADLKRRFPARVRDLRRGLEGLKLTRVDKFLEEYAAVNAVNLVLELSGENDCNAVVARADKDRLGITVVDDLELALRLYELQVRLLRARGLLVARLQLGLLSESREEGGRERVALQKRHVGDEVGALLCGVCEPRLSQVRACPDVIYVHRVYSRGVEGRRSRSIWRDTLYPNSVCASGRM